MPTDTYDRLSFLDNSFLLMETQTSPMHVSGMTTFEAASLQTTEGYALKPVGENCYEISALGLLVQRVSQPEVAARDA